MFHTLVYVTSVQVAAEQRTAALELELASLRSVGVRPLSLTPAVPVWRNRCPSAPCAGRTTCSLSPHGEHVLLSTSPLSCFTALRSQVPLPLLSDSTVMSTVPSAVSASFRQLLQERLPATRFELLYRGTRDGLCPAAFHAACDDRGGTLTVIQCKGGHVFGGYTSAPWCSPPSGKANVRCDSAFVFTVRNPHGVAPTCFPVRTSWMAVVCDRRCGPCFGNDIVVSNGDSADTAKPFTSASSTPFPTYYSDSIGKGNRTFCGTYNFTPTEVEVWCVC